MIHRTAAFLALLFVLVSCDGKQDRTRSDSSAESHPETTRAARPRDVPSTRDKLHAAWESAKTREPRAERDQAIAALAWQALESAPDLAALAIRELSAGAAEKPALIEAYLQQLIAEEKTEEAIVWADSLGAAPDITAAREKIALLLAVAHPEKAATLLPASSFTAAGVDPAAAQVLGNWTISQPTAAAAWAARLPQGESRAAGLKMVFSRWIQADTQSALNWTKSQNQPHTRKEALQALVEAFSGQPDPIRDSLLEPADPALRAEIEQGIAEAARQSAPSEPSEPDPQPETELESAPEVAPVE